jgi:hypothetical protein
MYRPGRQAPQQLTATFFASATPVQWNKPYHFIDRARKRATEELMNEWI